MYVMFIDEEAMRVFNGNPIQWADADWTSTWRPNGIDPTIFPHGELPMKRVRLENGETDHSIALK